MQQWCMPHAQNVIMLSDVAALWVWKSGRHRICSGLGSMNSIRKLCCSDCTTLCMLLTLHMVLSTVVCLYLKALQVVLLVLKLPGFCVACVASCEAACYPGMMLRQCCTCKLLQ